jgi:Raf kinase inhibitor-like YbhB/YbcL family protein
MQLTSRLFTNQTPIPADYTCKGSSLSPSLQIEGTPPDTRSLVFVMHDPDAPAGDFTHWVVWGIPPETGEIPEDSLPAGSVQGVNDFGAVGYGAPCPPSGTHRYVFELYALDIVLTLPQGSPRKAVEAALDGHIITQAQLVGLCSA